MKIYLDTCSIQRPLDSKNQIRIVLEADAVLGIIASCDMGQMELVSSEALIFEVSRSTNQIRKRHSLAVLEKANITIAINDIIERRSKLFVKVGVKPLDALHLASAEFAGADYLCTCDDRFLKRAQKMDNLSVRVVSPITLIEELEL